MNLIDLARLKAHEMIASITMLNRNLLKSVFVYLFFCASVANAATDQNGNQTAILNQAIVYFKNDDYVNCINNLLKSNEINPRADAYLLEGLAFLKLGQPYDARSAFSMALEIPADQSVHDDALIFLKQIKEGLWSRSNPFSTFIDLSAGFNSNVFTNANNEKHFFEPISQNTFALGYSLQQEEPLSFKLAYVFSWDEIINFPQNRIMGQLIQGQINYSFDPWLFQAEPKFLYQSLGNHSFLNRPGIKFTFYRNFSADQIGATYSFDLESALDTNYFYLTGHSHESRIFCRHFGNNYDFAFVFQTLFEEIGDLSLSDGTLPLANHSFAPGIEISYYPESKWQMDLNAFYFLRNYLHPSTFDGDKRRDLSLSLWSKIAYRLSPTMSIYASPSLILNTSNFGENSVQDKNYRQWLTLLGLTWENF